MPGHYTHTHIRIRQAATDSDTRITITIIYCIWAFWLCAVENCVQCDAICARDAISFLVSQQRVELQEEWPIESIRWVCIQTSRHQINIKHWKQNETKSALLRRASATNATFRCGASDRLKCNVMCTRDSSLFWIFSIRTRIDMQASYAADKLSPIAHIESILLDEEVGSTY